MPTIYDRKEVIKFSNDLECKCGRVKNKPHCPQCGSKAKIRAYVQANPANLPNGDVLNSCVNYHCGACGNNFDDIDWYFNCHAPLDIDWVATKAKMREQEEQNKHQQEWIVRVQQDQIFTHNDYTKCKAQTGIPLEEIIALVKRERRQAEKQTTEIQAAKTSSIEILTLALEKTRKQIIANEENLQADPNDKDIILALDFLRKKLKNIEDEINSTKGA